MSLKDYVYYHQYNSTIFYDKSIEIRTFSKEYFKLGLKATEAAHKNEVEENLTVWPKIC